MNQGTALYVAGLIFGLVAILHLIRIFFKTEIKVGNKLIPLSASWIGFIVAFLLCIWMFMAY